jgi:hypothetical protein
MSSNSRPDVGSFLEESLFLTTFMLVRKVSPSLLLLNHRIQICTFRMKPLEAAASIAALCSRGSELEPGAWRATVLTEVTRGFRRTLRTCTAQETVRISYHVPLHSSFTAIFPYIVHRWIVP